MSRISPLTTLIAGIALGIGLLTGCGRAADDHETEPPERKRRKTITLDNETLGNSINAFALDLYGRLRQSDQNAGENLFVSPFSISTALAMTYAGADGETARQMQEALQLPSEGEGVHQSYEKLLDHLNGLQKEDELQLSVANALWGQKGYGFRNNYLDLTQQRYGAGLEQVNFRQDVEAARKTINDWVAEKTEDKIKDLIPRGALTNMTRLVLTNAIYFKARWANVFEENATRDKPFKLLDGSKVDVPTMHQTERFGYGETQDVKWLEMPYKGHKTSMVILLPKNDSGLAALEKSLTSRRLTKWLDETEYTRVSAAIPKFKLTSKFMLGDMLKAMGMTDAFDPEKADFTGMSDRGDLFIQAAIHKAYVDVYEKGTEAAAATGIAVGVTSVQTGKPKQFRADHPFLFLIRDRESGSILFMGRVMNPEK